MGVYSFNNYLNWNRTHGFVPAWCGKTFITPFSSAGTHPWSPPAGSVCS